ncbi:hypothetical protein Tco_0762884 [Tanacetum coccineum]
MYLTASRLDIMFDVCAYARFQVTLKASHLNAVKRIFRYLKHQPKLGLWYPRDSPFELEAFSDSDYGGASLDRKSTTGGCQFLGRRLISWQCKKQTIVANSTTKAEYVAAANCCGQTFEVRRSEGISSLSNEEIFEHLAHKGSKKPTWDQFNSNIATTIIYLATSRRFNFSKFIFEAMVKNLDSPHKFLLYPRFIQLLLNKQQRLLLPHTRTYPTPTLTSKLYSNMRRASKGYSGVVTPLFEKPIQPTHKAGETNSMPHDSPLQLIHSHEVLEARRKAKIILSDDEEIVEDSSKQGRKISQIDKDPIISLVQDEGISQTPQEEEVHKKLSDETKVLVQEETHTDIIEEHGSGEKGEMEISTANLQVSTASPPKVSTTVPHVYTRRSAKDKGKAIMEEPATLKKVKKRTQVQLGMDEKLARKMEEEEERIRFNAEQEARALQEEEEERLNLEAAKELQRQLDQRHEDPRLKKDSSKPSEKETSKTVEEEKVKEEEANPEPVLIEKKAVGIRRKTLARRRASDKQGQDSSKRQKKEKEIADYEEEKDELRMWLTVVPDEEAIVDPEVLHTKFPIVDWES